MHGLNIEHYMHAYQPESTMCLIHDHSSDSQVNKLILGQANASDGCTFIAIIVGSIVWPDGHGKKRSGNTS